MKTRNYEHIRVDFANAQILRETNKIPIQTMLNGYYRQNKKRNCV